MAMSPMLRVWMTSQLRSLVSDAPSLSSFSLLSSKLPARHSPSRIVDSAGISHTTFDRQWKQSTKLAFGGNSRDDLGGFYEDAGICCQPTTRRRPPTCPSASSGGHSSSPVFSNADDLVPPSEEEPRRGSGRRVRSERQLTVPWPPLRAGRERLDHEAPLDTRLVAISLLGVERPAKVLAPLRALLLLLRAVRPVRRAVLGARAPRAACARPRRGRQAAARRERGSAGRNFLQCVELMPLVRVRSDLARRSRICV